jgi:hypothetical protein
VFEAGPIGPVVFLGIVLGVPLARPLSVIPEPPPDDMPVVLTFFTAWELVFVILGLSKSV